MLKEALSTEYMRRLNAMQLKLNSKARAGYAGMRKSSAKGSSQEFSDFRDYSPGDDIRRIDWNGYSRFDRLFVKLYSDEKRGEVNFFIDKSASMDYGEVNKLFYAKLLAASLAYIALNNADRVNIYCWDETVSARGGASNKNAFPALVEFLDGIEPEGRSAAAGSLKASRPAAGACYVISDFFLDDGYQDAVKHLQSQKQDVCLVQLLSTAEAAPDMSEGLRLTDAEISSYRDVYITEDILKGYAAALKRYKQTLSDYCVKRGVKYICATTDTQALHVVSKLIS